MAMLLLPIVYLLLISALVYVLWLYATEVLPQISPNFLTVVLYAGPLVAGAIVVFFTLKPFLAQRPERPPRLSLDPNRERLLVDFVERLCVLLRAPRPWRIDVDLQPNASASLQGGVRSLLRRRIVLTIGLPLVAGLNTSELAGVLAHELSHFGQGTGMRLTFVISSINLWFARVAFERDKWDRQLENSTARDFRVRMVLGLARASVAATRSILKGLLWAGHVVSCFLLRQMEYDADRCQALLSGSGAFESCIRRINGMALASQMVGQELQRAWARHELPDDIPYLVAQRFRHAGQLIDRAVDEAATKATGMFETHPAMGDRIGAVRKLNTPGVFRDDRPAADLFSNFADLSRTATRQFYEKQQSLSLDGVRLVPSDSFLAGEEGGDRQRRALATFFEGTPFSISPLPTAPPASSMLVEDLLRQFGDARQRMRREQARANDALRRYEGSGVRFVNLALAQHLTPLGVELSQLPINLRLEDIQVVGIDGAIARARTRASTERDAVLVELAALEQSAVDRIEAALALLRHTPGPLIDVDTPALLDQAYACGAFLNALDALRPAMRELHAGGVTLKVLEDATVRHPNPAAVKHQISKLQDEMLPILRRVVANACHFPHPLGEAGAGTIAAYLTGPGELTLAFALPRLLLLADQCFSRVIEITVAVEHAWSEQPAASTGS